MGTIKDRNCTDFTESKDTKKRGQEYTEKLYKKVLTDPDNHKDVITHLEPDILESEVKWILGSITMNKLVKTMEFQLSCFLKEDAVKVLHSTFRQIWKTEQWPQD